jgi:hypothetical protein
MAGSQRRVVTHVLAMVAIENRAPMALVILFEAGDYAVHFTKK